ncbi:MAG TPA: hypothetical protein VFI06_02315, partial [Chitinophagaceae bacterium]|nr:hypothetical protein [Chitinophagaceae bacterium]
MSDLKNKLEKIETYHTEGKNGVLEIISHKRTFKKLPFILSLCVSLTISIVILLFVPNKSFKILSTGCDLLIVIFPSLLGFSLGGYALIVGFGNIDLLKKATRINAY